MDSMSYSVKKTALILQSAHSIHTQSPSPNIDRQIADALHEEVVDALGQPAGVDLVEALREIAVAENKVERIGQRDGSRELHVLTLLQISIGRWYCSSINSINAQLALLLDQQDP